MSKTITHINKLNDSEDSINDFCKVCAEGLQNKLRCVLFQLPPGIHYSAEKLQQITNSLNPELKNVVEFRHASWWQQNVYDALSEKQIIFCSVSHHTLLEAIIANTKNIYIKLHGNIEMFYSHYSTAALKDLYNSVVNNKKIKEAFIYFNNTASAAGILNAQELVRMI